MQEYLLYCGFIASVWLVVGIYLAGMLYPNYSHVQQFCSELGAKGAPTERLSPAINNYPLGLLFCLFGIGIILKFNASTLLIWVGIMVIVHGVGTWVAGYFPMDKDPYTDSPSSECKIHSWAGFLMLLAFLIAPILMIFHPITNNIPTMFKWFSLLCILASIFSLYLFKKAFQRRLKLGIHQRVSYGIQIFWLNGLSYVLLN